MNIFKKLIFLIKRPCIILVTGKGCFSASEAIFQVLNPYFKARKISNNKLPLVKDKNEILIFENELADSQSDENIEELIFLFKKSQLPILAVTHIGEIPSDKNLFACLAESRRAGKREKTSLIRKIVKTLPDYGFLILNSDDETAREIKKESSASSLTYGFQKGADFQATDININLDGTNFKINHQGNIVPFWLNKLFGKELIYSALAGICLGTIKKINLVDMSQTLKSYKSLPGKMRLIEGVKNSLVLDDSKNATPFSMIEALEILGKLPLRFQKNSGAQGRKIAVLGDILGVGKYTIEAHEAIGENAAQNSDLLFTVGLRARFIAQAAGNKGMREENIFTFDTTKEAKIQLQKEIKQNDLILIDGSSEMKMGEIVEEIEKKELSSF